MESLANRDGFRDRYPLRGILQAAGAASYQVDLIIAMLELKTEHRTRIFAPLDTRCGNSAISPSLAA